MSNSTPQGNRLLAALSVAFMLLGLIGSVATAFRVIAQDFTVFLEMLGAIYLILACLGGIMLRMSLWANEGNRDRSSETTPTSELPGS